MAEISFAASAADVGETPATAGAISLGEVLTGVIDFAQDIDLFRVDLLAGRSYRAYLEGFDTNAGTLRDPLLGFFSVRDGELTLEAEWDDDEATLNSSGVFTAAASGSFYLGVRSYDDEVGSYRLTFVEARTSLLFDTAAANILRSTAALVIDDVAQRFSVGDYTQEQAIARLVQAADATTSVATLAYQFFTGKIPTDTGLDFLVSPTGPNPNNLNSAYFQSFNLENRYINFAVSLGKLGEGKAAFTAEYGGLSLAGATKKAYSEIFGAEPTDAKVEALLAGGRDLYFATYGGDGLGGIGTKAAMVGWLLAEAEKANVGVYAKSNAAFLTDLADGATYNVDLIGVYGTPEYNYLGS